MTRSSKREVAALAAQPGKTDEQVGRDLGVSAPGASRAGGDAAAAPAPTEGAAPGVGAWCPRRPSREELEREVRALRREVAEVRQQREIL